MDLTLNSQDFAPAIHSTALPANTAPVAPCSDFSTDDNDADLLAAVDMADALSQAAMATEKKQEQVGPQNDSAAAMEEDWDEEDLAKIAEMEQSMCIDGNNAAPAYHVVGSDNRTQSEHTAVAGPGESSAAASLAKLRGENQILRDRQAAYELRISKLQEKMTKREEEMRTKEAQEHKQLRDTIEKLTTTLQFNKQDIDELRKKNERLAQLKQTFDQQQQQQAKALSTKSPESDFPTVRSFHSQATAAQLKRGRVSGQHESENDSVESAAKRRRTSSPRPNSSSPKPVEVTPSPRPDSKPVVAAAREELNSRLLQMSDALDASTLGSSHCSLLHKLLRPPSVSSEVQEVCRSLDVKHIDITGILEMNSASSSPIPTMTDDPAATGRHGLPALLNSPAPSALDGSKDRSRAFGMSSLEVSSKSQLLRHALCAAGRSSTPLLSPYVVSSPSTEPSLSAVTLESDKHRALGVWLSKVDQRLGELCRELVSFSDATPDLLPSALSQQPYSSSCSALPSSSSPASIESKCRSLSSLEKSQQRNIVETLCLLDHLLRCSPEAAWLVASASPSSAETETGGTKSFTSTKSTTTSTSLLGGRSPTTPRGSPLPPHHAQAPASANNNKQLSDMTTSATEDATAVTPHGLFIRSAVEKVSCTAVISFCGTVGFHTGYSIMG